LLRETLRFQSTSFADSAVFLPTRPRANHKEEFHLFSFASFAVKGLAIANRHLLIAESFDSCSFAKFAAKSPRDSSASAARNYSSQPSTSGIGAAVFFPAP
jgi:hypothetical protein